MLVLCGSAISNYYNKVKLALLEKGIPFREEYVGTGGSDEDMLSASPLAKIPFIRTEQGPLCESQAILEYIEAAYPT
ncbi:MAG: glutathione S-transferase N-terminal domain-containing protein, partial [Pseudomonadota bacterium]|nr:glutathione S-transferase N-terminal domain-containing protein [Pseudomonadota bacterium]